jgi:MFS family permease
VNLQPVLLLLGGAFLVANALRIAEYLRFLKRRHGALLTWTASKPPYYWLGIAIGAVLGGLVVLKLWSNREAFRVGRLGRYPFGEIMMFVYYAYLTPLTARIRRGFYQDGIWADTTFIPYTEIGGISWREGEHQVTLLITSKLRNLARRLIVPGDKYAAARRLLRDKIGDHEIHFSGTGLNLGQDARDNA